MSSNKSCRLTRLCGSGYKGHVISVLLRDAGVTLDDVAMIFDDEMTNRLR